MLAKQAKTFRFWTGPASDNVAVEGHHAGRA